MTDVRLDCNWCGSARSIEHGICQVCLMEYPVDTKVIELPATRMESRRTPIRRVKLDLTEKTAAEPKSAG